jgi:hypothetical protein
MPFVILPTNSISGGYDITNSLRFNGGSTDYLNRTLGTSTSRRIYTMSAWIKRSKLDVYGHIFTFGPNPGSWDSLRFDNDNKLAMRINDDTYVLQTSQVFRDLSAWYHIVCAVDTTQATASNRVKLYVNGSQVTAFTTSSYPVQNYDTAFTSGNDFRIGVATWNTSQNIDSYLAEAFIIDGQALTPSSFGETDEDTGIWKPKAFSGSYGTNGFYLQFKNSASLGTDSSGNGNTFTVNNLTSIDQTTDTPTNNFATLNPLAKSNGTLTEGNTLWSPSGNDASAWSTIPVNKGKWYFEMTKGTSGDAFISISQTPKFNGFQTDNDAVSISLYMYYTSGGTTTNRFQYNGSPTAFPSGFGDDDNGTIYGLTLDFDADQIIVRRNNDDTTKATFSIPSALKAEPLFVGYSVSFTWPSAQFYWNFGNPSYTIVSGNADANGYGNFEYAVPSGFYALCTKNLATFG